MPGKLYQALIRTHHITSRKKVATLKAAAKKLNCHALLRSGGVPGVMFVEGCDAESVAHWIDTVHGLRYKDYQLVSPVSSVRARREDSAPDLGVLDEVDSVKDLGAMMETKGLTDWWRSAMGFTPR